MLMLSLDVIVLIVLLLFGVSVDPVAVDACECHDAFISKCACVLMVLWLDVRSLIVLLLDVIALMVILLDVIVVMMLLSADVVAC